MERSEYLPMFLAECREHLQELNLAVVRVEEAPDDRETVDEIFRIAHSLKGMSATMGFARMAELTHAMEDVFELLRQRRGGLDRGAIDVLLACLDALEAAVDAIEASGDEALDQGPLVERLHALVRAPGEEPADTPHADPGAIAAEALARRVLHVRVELVDDVAMPSVRAFMVLSALADQGEVVGSEPAAEALDGFDGRTVEIWLATDRGEEIVAEAAGAVADVEKVAVEELAPPAAEETATTPEAAAPAALRANGTRKGASTVRVDAERLDQLMHLMGELVVHRTHVMSLAAGLDVPGLQQAMQDLTRSSQALQAMVMQVRMIPVEAVFLRFPRLVRDLSGKLDKQVELVLTGQETELDRTVVDALGDPLVHLVRNALDHGLESSEERVAAGKPAHGRLEIGARHAGGNVVISVSDDGRGIDPARVAGKAAQVGLIPADAVDAVDTARAIELLFAPGFSTAEQTSDVSGRGVGMDAVRTTIRELGGDVVLRSEPGAGSTAEIRLPLTLAIMAALLVESAGIPFAIPLERVERTLAVGDAERGSVAGKPMLVLRDGVLPLSGLGAALGYDGDGVQTHAVIVHGGGRRLALGVDALVGQRELVTRPLPPELQGRAPLSGGAVLSNGQIALIVDCDALVAGPAVAKTPALAA